MKISLFYIVNIIKMVLTIVKKFRANRGRRNGSNASKSRGKKVCVSGKQGAQGSAGKIRTPRCFRKIRPEMYKYVSKDTPSYKKMIRRNKRYRNMRGNLTPIAQQMSRTKYCPLCGVPFQNKKGLTIRHATDHLHATEDSNTVCSFRDKLCQSCNTGEGIDLKRSSNEKDHVYRLVKRIYKGSPSPNAKSILTNRVETLLSKGKTKDPVLRLIF